MSEQVIKVPLTVLEAMELARLCHQFKEYSIINGCYYRLFESVMEQALPGEVKSVSSVPSEEHHAFYFPDLIAE